MSVLVPPKLDCRICASAKKFEFYVNFIILYLSAYHAIYTRHLTIRVYTSINEVHSVRIITNECLANSVHSYLVNTGNWEPITLKRANNSPIVVKNSTIKRFFDSVVHALDDNVNFFPFNMHRSKCAILRTEI